DRHLQVGVNAVGGEQLRLDIDQLFLLDGFLFLTRRAVDLGQADHELRLRYLPGYLCVQLDGGAVVASGGCNAGQAGGGVDVARVQAERLTVRSLSGVELAAENVQVAELDPSPLRVLCPTGRRGDCLVQGGDGAGDVTVQLAGI